MSDEPRRRHSSEFYRRHGIAPTGKQRSLITRVKRGLIRAAWKVKDVLTGKNDGNEKT